MLLSRLVVLLRCTESFVAYTLVHPNGALDSSKVEQLIGNSRVFLTATQTEELECGARWERYRFRRHACCSNSFDEDPEHKGRSLHREHVIIDPLPQ